MTLRRLRSLAEVTPEDRGASAAIGNFDGIHLGHQAILAQARRPGQPLAVLTFEPHPREVFRPEDPPFRLMRAESRAARLAEHGVDLLFELPFEPSLYALDDRAFCEIILVQGLGLKQVTVGANFRFGKGRTGDAETLRAHGQDLGFEVTVAEMVPAGSQRISSTAIRAALSAGDCAAAQAMLGAHHRIEGPVGHGEKRGRELGFPTANMDMSGLHLPRFGVYAVLVEIAEGPHVGTYGGAASLGVRPMFGENQPNLETYLFDFQGDLYGTHLSVSLIDFLRPEQRFDSLEALIAQMTEDCAQARLVLHPHLSQA